MIGAAILLFGRRLFWRFVAAVGFAAGVEIALVIALFDWALIVLSSIVGAHLIQSAITMPPTGATILFLVLTMIGIVVQVSMMRSRVVVAG